MRGSPSLAASATQIALFLFPFLSWSAKSQGQLIQGVVRDCRRKNEERKKVCCNFIHLPLFTFKFWLQMLPVSGLVFAPSTEFTDNLCVQPFHTCPESPDHLVKNMRDFSALSPCPVGIDRGTLPNPRTYQPSCNHWAPTWGFSPNTVCAARP